MLTTETKQAQRDVDFNKHKHFHFNQFSIIHMSTPRTERTHSIWEIAGVSQQHKCVTYNVNVHIKCNRIDDSYALQFSCSLEFFVVVVTM